MNTPWKIALYSTILLLVGLFWWWYNRAPRFTEDQIIAAAVAGDDRLLADILGQQPGLLRVKSSSGNADLMLLAARSGNAVCIDILAQRGLRADGTDRFGQSAIDHLAEGEAPRRGEALARLIEAGAHIDPARSMALLLGAAQRGDGVLISALVTMGVPVTTADERGWTVVHAAMAAGHKDFAEGLLKEFPQLRGIRGDGSAVNSPPAVSPPQ